MVTLVPQQASIAVGGVNDQTEPHCTVMLLAQVITGGWVSTSMTRWPQKTEFEQQSVMIQKRANTFEHWLAKIVTLLRTVMVTLLPQQASKAVGVSKVHPEPHSTVLGPAQVTTGGFVSMMLTVSVQKAAFEQQSTAFQFKVMIWLHGTIPLVTALTSETVTLEPQHASKANGGVGCQPPGVPAAFPHW